MKKTIIAFLTSVIAIAGIAQDGYKIGDRVDGFSLVNVDGKTLSLSDYNNEEGVIVIFTCNTCPYAKAYESRIMQLDVDYREKGFPVVAINSNDPKRVPGDSYENMKVRSKSKDYSFPYVYDKTQEVAHQFGAMKTPHVYLLKNNGSKGFHVSYIGAIDDSPMEKDEVDVKYLESAIQAVKEGKNPDPAITRAIGCTIKWMQ